MKKFYILLVIIIAMTLTACSVEDKNSSDNMDIKSTLTCKVQPKKLSEKKYDRNCEVAEENLSQILNKKAIMQTDKGKIEITLDAQKAPVTVANFIFLSQEGYYDGLIFHRREDSINIIQGGDPSGNGTGGPGYTIKEEPPSSNTDYKKGVLAMAKTSLPNSTGSQFFIMLDDFEGFNPEYTIFGNIVSGQDVAQSIRVGDKIMKVTIE